MVGDGSSGRAKSRSASRWRLTQGWVFPTFCIALIFGAHIAYGAIRIEAALAATALAGALLTLSLVVPVLRQDLARVRGLLWPALLFALVMVAGALSLTPYAPGGPHPTWAYLGLERGSASIDPSATILELVKLLGLASIFLLGAIAGASDDRARATINWFLIAAGLYALWAFFGFTTGTVFQTQSRRLEGSLMSPNTAGTFFGVVLVIALGAFLSTLRGGPSGRHLNSTTAYGLGVMAFSACLLLTASRGAAMGVALAVATLFGLLFFSGRINWSRASLITFTALLVGFLGVAVFGERLIERWANWDADAASRQTMFAIHWRAFLDAPLSGYGLGTFDIIHRISVTAETLPAMWTVRATHNVYIQWLEEAGLVGALPMFACIAVIIGVALVRGFKRSRMTYLLFALIAANVVTLVHGYTDFALQTPSFALMWSFLLGLQFALSQGSGR